MNSRRLLSSFFIFIMCMITSCTSASKGLSSQDIILSAATKSRFTTQVAQEGPRIECRTATADEINLLGPQAKDLGSLHFCMFEVKGLCPGEQYVLYGVNLKGEVNALASHIADDNEISFRTLATLNNFMKGETISYVVLHPKTNNVWALTVAPNPIQASWDDGATLSMTALDETMEVWYLVGKGFQPNEMLRSTSRSWDEKIESEIQASEKGSFIELRLPAIIGQNGGINIVTIERAETGEKRTIKVPYGSKAWR